MTTKKKLTLAAWICSMVTAAGAFLPLLQFSFNRYPVNLFGICEEFASRDRAALRIYPPLGYITFALIIAAALCQVLYLIKAAKSGDATKGTQGVSMAMTIASMIAFAVYLLLVLMRSSYTPTIVPFLMIIAGTAYIFISGKIKKLQ